MLISKNFKFLRHRAAHLIHRYRRLISDQKQSLLQQSRSDAAVNAVLSSDHYGQPTAATHPHLLNDGELVPGISVEEFQQRRIRLMNGLQKFSSDNISNENSKNHLLLVPSASKKYMSDHIPYVFRQNSDFYYLTGCMEQDSLLMLTLDEQNEMKSTLFMRPKDKHAELWDGARTGVERAPDFFGVHEAYSIDRLQSILQRHIEKNKPRIWYDTQLKEQPNVTKSIERLAADANCSTPQTPATFIQSMRLFKSPAEQELMRRTCEIASTAINETIRDSRPGISEHHIFAMVDYKCRMQNASYLAYPPVVASGINATTIHYINNTQVTKSGELVLLDAGCEYGGYTSDITRTWPIAGSFTEPQRVLYEVVLTLQKELIGVLLKDGGDTLDNLFEYMCIRLGKYLQEVGLVSKSITDPQALGREGYKFCPHHVSHYLGMDVHDTPLMPRSLRLLPGMVFTVEPGIYIGCDRPDVPKEFRGIGIRIEDDVLVTEKREIEILTKNCIKEISELENLFKEKRGGRKLGDKDYIC